MIDPNTTLTKEHFEKLRELFGPCSALYEAGDWDDFTEEHPVPTIKDFVRTSLAVEDIFIDRVLGGMEDPDEHAEALAESNAFLANIRKSLHAAGYPTEDEA